MGNCKSQLMGCLCDNAKDLIPTEGTVSELVTERIPEIVYQYEKYYFIYKRGMEEKAPGKYICQEVLDKNTEEGKMTLTKGVDNDEKVKMAALLAATNEDFRDQIKDDVWDELEPQIKEKAEMLIKFEPCRDAALRRARKGCDELVDKAIDQVFDDLANKIKKGQPLPPPKAPKKKMKGVKQPTTVPSSPTEESVET